MATRAGDFPAHRHDSFVPVRSGIRSVKRLAFCIGARLDGSGTLYPLVLVIGIALTLYCVFSLAGGTRAMS